MEYSVIIPVYNGEKTISACVQSLLDQNINRDRYEIIVMDDGSMDKTREKTTVYTQVRYMYQENSGPAVARNNAVKIANGEIVLFIDADCEASRDWILEMTKPFVTSEIVGTKGAYRTKQDEWVARIVQMEYEMKYERMKRERYIDFIDTYSAAFRREVFIKTGGFDTTFPCASVEDQEFSFRLSGLGYKMVFNPDAIVYHLHSSSIPAYCKKKFKIAFWKISVLERHPGKILRDSHTPQTLKFEIFFAYLAIILFFASVFVVSRIFLFSGSFFLVIFIFLAIVEIKSVFLHDLRLSVLSIFLLFLRSLALGSGLICGIIRKLYDRKK